MNCMDCLHCDVCGVWKNAESLTQQMEKAETLKCFRNKANVVELPCKVGDTVYEVGGRFYNDIIKCEVIEIAQDKTGMTIKTQSWDKIHDISGLLQRCDRWFDADNFGKTVFLTREEAALKARDSKCQE